MKSDCGHFNLIAIEWIAILIIQFMILFLCNRYEPNRCYVTNIISHLSCSNATYFDAISMTKAGRIFGSFSAQFSR